MWDVAGYQDFWDSLISFLDVAERVEADDGYIGEASRHVKCPKSFTNLEETTRMQTRIQSRQETANKQAKHFGILKQMYRHEIADHGDAFHSCIVFIQVSIEKGEPLFGWGYKDRPFNNPYEETEDDAEL